MKTTPMVLVLAFAAPFALDARVLGEKLPQLTLTGGRAIINVTPLSYSAETRMVNVSSGHFLSSIPLDQFPLNFQSFILADYDTDRVRIVPETVTTTVRTPATAPVPTPPPPAPAPSPKTIFPAPTFTGDEALKKEAATQAPDELRFSLQKTFSRITALDCKIRTAERPAGWQHIRVTGVASFSKWNSFKNDYVWRTGKFEVVFDIIEGNALKISTVTFDGLAQPVDKD